MSQSCSNKTNPDALTNTMVDVDDALWVIDVPLADVEQVYQAIDSVDKRYCLAQRQQDEEQTDPSEFIEAVETLIAEHSLDMEQLAKTYDKIADCNYLALDSVQGGQQPSLGRAYRNKAQALRKKVAKIVCDECEPLINMYKIMMLKADGQEVEALSEALLTTLDVFINQHTLTPRTKAFVYHLLSHHRIGLIGQGPRSFSSYKQHCILKEGQFKGAC